MAIIVHTVTLSIILASVQSLDPAQEKSDVFDKLIELLSKKSYRRLDDMENLYRAKTHRDKHTNNLMKQILRGGANKEDVGDIPADPDDKLAEQELQNSMNQKKSALLDRPYVETEGKRDFLVISSDVFDQFVTVIPNSIYQRIEKRCVNWLDDCSLKGIRARLLRGVRLR